LDLPFELRQIIFEFMLIAEERIEYTPHALDKEELGRLRWDAVRAYRRSTSKAIGLLKVSRATREQTGPIFYGQEFGFSITFGWTMLYRFLLTMGRWKIRHLRNLALHIPFEPLELVFSDGEQVWNGARILPEERPSYEAILNFGKNNYKPRPYPMKEAYPIWAMIQRLNDRNKRLQMELVHLHHFEELGDQNARMSPEENESSQILDREEQQVLVGEALKRGWTVRRMYYNDEGQYRAQPGT
jgi:hypothetical protein